MQGDAEGPQHDLLNRAVHAIRTLRQRLDRSEAARRMPVAIIGMACRFPGASGLAAFWDLLAAGRDPLGPVPAERWDIESFYSPDPQAPGKTVAREGGYLSGLEWFDADFFGISPREAVFIDPRQRLMLETAWESLEDAGVPPRSLAGSRTGVFVGTLTDDYHQLITAEPHWISAATGTGTANSIVANRISYFLDLRGPSVALDAACAGSLMAILLGVKAIRDGEADLALCGGVAVNLLPSPDISFSRMGALAPGARCRTFDQDAAGMVRSEGAGMVVLKPLDQALADGDRVHAVIRGGATNHDGRSNGIASPNGAAQEALLRDAYAQSGIEPGLVQYIEAHGTGTTVGDRIEIQALTRMLGTGRPAGRPVAIGSVKSNIGHTESAAGVAGVIKTALALEHRVLPPNLHIQTLNPALAEAPIAITVPQALSPFPMPDERLTAGVSGFSFGGSNVHLVLEEAERPPVRAVSAERPELCLLPLSAASPAALREQARRYAGLLVAPDRPRLADICYTAAERRSHLEHRLAVAGRDAAELAGRLLAFADGTGEQDTGREALIADQALRRGEVNLAFFFSGQGSEWLGMGRDLIAAEPCVADAIARMEPLFLRHAGWSLAAALDDATTWPRDIDVIQPTVFALQVALAALWQSLGVRPNAIVGQSMGEVAAAHVAGALDLETAIRVIVARSRLMREAMRQGATAVIGLPADDMRARLDRYGGRLDIAGTTSFTATLVAGETDALRNLLGALEDEGVFGRLLDTVEVAAHSPAMDPLCPRLAAAVADIVPRPAAVPLWSTVTAGPIAGTELDAGYWARNLRQPFRAAETVARMGAEGCSLFLEVSPHPVVVGALRQCLEHAGIPGRALRSLTRTLDGPLAMRSALGGLHAAGFPIDWERLRAPEARPADLPTYPWQRTRHWVDALGTPNLFVGSTATRGVHPLLGAQTQLAGTDTAVVFERTLDRSSLAWLPDHAIGNAPVLPAAAYLEMALAAVRHGFGWEQAEIGSARFERLLALPKDGALTVQTLLRRTGDGTASVAVHARPADPVGSAGASAWTRHATLDLQSSGSSATPPGPPARPLPDIEVDGFYADLAGRGLCYGPAFRGIARVSGGDGSAFGEIALPAAAGSSSGYIVHPALLDAAIQVVAAALPADGQVYLPTGAAGLRIFGPIQGTARISVRLLDDAAPAQRTLAASILLSAPDGQVLARIARLELTALNAAGAALPDPSRMLYRLDWRAARPEPVQQPGRFLVCADRGGFGDAIAAELERRGARCLMLHAGPQGLAELRAAAAEPVLGLVNTWNLDAAAPDEGGPEATARSILGTALAAVQALAGRQVPVALITRGAQAVQPDGRDLVALPQAALWGFGRVLALEHPELSGGMLDLDPAMGPEQASLAVDALLASGPGRQQALRGGIRLEANLVRAEPVPATALTLRPDATYLITGGLSGLGLRTAQWLAERGARRLLLLGRRVPPPRAQWRAIAPGSETFRQVTALRDLEALGVSVQVAACDVAERDALAAILERHRQELHPPIRGIVHAAGQIADGLMLSMTPDAFDAPMAAKVAGAWNLHTLTRSLELDFFVLYASATGVLGQVGQANYAAANAFEDALAWHRRALGLPATALDWGPWAEIGIYARSARREQAGLTGVTDIAPADGMAALETVLRTGAVQTVVVDADWTRVQPTPLIQELTTITSGEPADDAEQADAMAALLLLESAERRRAVRTMVATIIAAVLRLEPAQIDAERQLTAFGMDSIMAVEIRNRVRRRFGMSLSIAVLFTGSVAEIAALIDEGLLQDAAVAAALDEVEALTEREDALAGASSAA